jgi:replication-associated recombination protein RarA
VARRTQPLERYNLLQAACVSGLAEGAGLLMGYQVLARKYRPQRFADVAGQDHVTRTLMNALSQNRIAHGYIFSGHRGIGKTTIARIVARAPHAGALRSLRLLR